MADLIDLTIIYLPGAETFLQEEGPIIINLGHDGIDVTAGDPRLYYAALNHPPSMRQQAGRWLKTSVWYLLAFFASSIILTLWWQQRSPYEAAIDGFPLAGLDLQDFPASQTASPLIVASTSEVFASVALEYDDPLLFRPEVFPLAANLFHLLEDCGRLYHQATFIGFTALESHRLISGPKPGDLDDGGARLWEGSLFASTPHVDRLCDMVLNYDIFQGDGRASTDPDSTSKETLTEFCIVARAALDAYSRLWHSAMHSSRLLAMSASRKTQDLVDLLGQVVPKDNPPIPTGWQMSAANITLQTSCTIRPDEILGKSLNELAAAATSAAAPLATIRTFASFWLYGVTSHMAVARPGPQFCLIRPRPDNNATSIDKTRTLLSAIGTLEAHIGVTSQRAAITAQTAVTLVNQWGRFCSELQGLADTRFQPVAQGIPTPSAPTTLKWTLEPPNTFIPLLYSAYQQVDALVVHLVEYAHASS